MTKNKPAPAPEGAVGNEAGAPERARHKLTGRRSNNPAGRSKTLEDAVRMTIYLEGSEHEVVKARAGGRGMAAWIREAIREKLERD